MLGNMAEVSIGTLEDFPEGRGTAILVGERRLAVFRVGESFFAVDDHCPHRRFPLHDGSISGGTIRCRTHGSCFDAQSGAVVRGPATRPTRTYPTRCGDGKVFVDVPES